MAVLRIIATSDLHAHLAGWDYHRDTAAPQHGLLALSPLIDALRSEVPGAILLDNGDFLQGSPLGDWAASVGGQDPHPVISTMNALGYDAANVGNHEFSHGLPLLRRAADQARFPFLSSNLRLSDAPFFRSGVIMSRRIDGLDRDLRIGLCGIAPPQTPIWEGRILRDALTAEDPLSAAIDATRRLRAAAADIVILLAHTGFGEEDPVPMMENAAIPLARQSGADAIILGHTHALYPQGGETLARPAVMPGFHGSHLGCIDLDLVPEGCGLRLRRHRTRLLPAVATPPSPPLAATVAPAHAATRDWLRQPVGTTDIPLHAHFSRVVPSDLTRLVAAAQAEHVRAHLPPHQRDGRPILSAAAPFSTGGRTLGDTVADIPPGALTLRHLITIYPHPNTVIALCVTGAEVLDWLERAVVQFHRIFRGSIDTPLIDHDSPAFDFDLIDGLSFGIDLTAAPRFDTRGGTLHDGPGRITGLTHDGRPVRPADRFILATNSHRAFGSGGFPACRPDRILLDDGTPSRQTVADYIASFGSTPPSTGTWNLAPLPGTTVLLDAPAGADRHLDAIARFRPESLPHDRQTGLHRFRLHL